MAILRMKEITAMSPEDRTKKLTELRTELSRIRTMISAGGAVENPTRARELRKTIAQLLTVENEQKLGIRATKTEKKPKPSPAEKKPKETKPE
jgi:large subunit ribosomal protein L29